MRIVWVLLLLLVWVRVIMDFIVPVDQRVEDNMNVDIVVCIVRLVQKNRPELGKYKIQNVKWRERCIAYMEMHFVDFFQFSITSSLHQICFHCQSSHSSFI